MSKVRIGLVIAGLAWFFGLTPPWYERAVLAVIVIGGLVLDAYTTEQQKAQAPPPNYRTAA
ncbi:hypothetical protein ACIRD2_03140 [Streptomyces sp. NPDC093595]|uniref:hypothetical protein n=1 Tax=Streptomyces sp. NPDC093595 TaxID=3366045 RepID=UPI0037F19054